MFTLLCILAVSIAAALDGHMTNLAIAKGQTEVDPIMVWIFGTNKPTPKTVWVRGGIAIAVESAIVLGLSHWLPYAGIILLLQAGLHLYEYFHNS